MPLTRGVDLQDEARFREWFSRWAQRTGVNRDPDQRDAKYDFRAAWHDRADPVWSEEDKKWSWQDEYSYEKQEQPAPQYELTMTINGVKLVPQQMETEDA